MPCEISTEYGENKIPIVPRFRGHAGYLALAGWMPAGLSFQATALVTKYSTAPAVAVQADIHIYIYIYFFPFGRR